MEYEVEINGRLRKVTLHRTGERFEATVDGRVWTIDGARVDSHTWSLLADAPTSRSYEVGVATEGPSAMRVSVGSTPISVVVNPRRGPRRADRAGHVPEQSAPEPIVSPMPGKVVRILVKPGDRVRARQPVAVVEAMKMENELRASRAGVVTEVQVREAQLVDARTVLAVIAPAGPTREAERSGIEK